MESKKAANKLKIDTVIKNLEKRGMEGHYCQTSEEAVELILSMIPDKTIVSWGGSATLNELGVKGKLAERDLEIIDPYSTSDSAESMERRRRGLLSDYYLMSTNALTMDGELVNIDGTSNRVAALCFGPKNVIVVAGANKLAIGLDDAFTRAKLSAAVPNNVRLKRNNPCTITGTCNNCLSKDCICCNIVTTRYCGTPGRIQVILVNEELGY
ncbi:lactate utilization protein [Anoxybacterium hadale]|uniref:Lactate utilization protein n=1 Tax=Anoxybacterium hadale TaxID=3408580 RepID=A0ACD1AG79_9FIRM|nr:lactate utilization protein [Clostridiales bacterium]